MAKPQPKPITKGDFFDFERARGYWTGIQTQAAWDRANAPCVKPDYVAWSKLYARDAQAGLDSLKRNPSAATFGSCHDFDMANDLWVRMYAVWRGAVPEWSASAWNDPSSIGYKCLDMMELNIFTGRCDDMPDWRAPDLRQRDDKIEQRRHTLSSSEDIRWKWCTNVLPQVRDLYGDKYGNCAELLPK